MSRGRPVCLLLSAGPHAVRYASLGSPVQGSVATAARGGQWMRTAARSRMCRWNAGQVPRGKLLMLIITKVTFFTKKCLPLRGN